MKVQVLVKNASKIATTSTTIDATVGAADTVLNVQEYIASLSNTFSFPDQKLLFKGKVLSGTHRLSECGVKDGDMLEFQFEASEQTLVKQLSDLLGKNTATPEELSLLYSYRYSVSFGDALKALGLKDVQIRSFVESQKCFCLRGDRVKNVEASEKATQPCPGLCPIKEDKAHGLIEVSIAIEVYVDGRSPKLLPRDEDDVFMRLESSDTVLRTKEIIAASEQMPFPKRDLLLGEMRLKDELSLAEAGVKNGSALVMAVHASEAALASQLAELLSKRTALSPSELGLHYCQRFGTPVSQALRTLGLHANLGRFLEGHSQFSITGGCVTLTNGPKLVTPMTVEEADARDALDHVIDLIREASFFSIGDVKRGRNADGEVQATIFVNGLPPSDQDTLLKGLQKAVASSLEAMRSDEASIDSANIEGEVMKVRIEGSQTVSIRFEAAVPVLSQ